MPIGEVILVIGGARSGKSHFAEKMAAMLSNDVIYVATARINDEEMYDRVKQHCIRRPSGWKTVEETHQLANILNSLPEGSVVIIDCLTIWMSNLLLDELMPRKRATSGEKEKYILNEARNIVGVARNKKLRLIMVSNEVGYGLVPEYELGRIYRDIAGRVNQQIAKQADKVFLVAAGIPIDLKQLGGNITREVI